MRRVAVSIEIDHYSAQSIFVAQTIMAAKCFNIQYDGEDIAADLDGICSMVVNHHSEMKRGDFVCIETGMNSEQYVIFNGEKLLTISSDDDLPEEFKVITEFPIQYWHADADVFLHTTAKVNFDYALFREQIVNNIKNDDYLYASFSHNAKEYRLIFDDLRDKDTIIKTLDDKNCYFSPHPIEIEMEEFPENYLYMISC